MAYATGLLYIVDYQAIKIRTGKALGVGVIGSWFYRSAAFPVQE